MNSAIHKATILLVLTGMLLSACGNNLWGTYSPNVTPTPEDTSLPTLYPTLTDVVPPPSTPEATITVWPTSTLLPTVTVAPGTPQPTIVYISQSGDSLEAVALHYGVQASEITSVLSLPTIGLLNPNTPLVIPNRLGQEATTPPTHIIPDAEVVYSTTAVGFDIAGYIQSVGGKLSTFRESVSTGWTTGSDEIQRLAFESSISPRMLLALIQYYTGWVRGQPKAGVDETYPLGYRDSRYSGLYQQLRLIVRELLAGY
jgi:LasA protease